MPIFSWPANAHISSEIVPVKVRAAGAGAAESALTARTRTANTDFMIGKGGGEPPPDTTLLARCHQVRGAGPGIHDPDPALPAVVRQAERLGRGPRHGDRHVVTRRLLAG